MTEPTPEELASVRDDSEFDADPFAKPITRPAKEPVNRLAPKRTNMPETIRLLPQAVDAEKGVLSSCLIAPNDIIPFCLRKKITADHFAMPAHGIIYSELLRMWEKNEAIDFITLGNSLRDSRLIEEAGGAAAVVDLFTLLPTAANAPHYVEIVEKKFTLREIVKVTSKFGSMAYEEQDDVPKLLDSLESQVMAIRRTRSRRGCTAREMALIGVEELQRRIDLKGKISGLSTGFPGLDRKTDGLHGGEFITIASVPSLGKSALANQICEHLSVDQRVPVLLFPLEMGRKQQAQRMILSRALVNAAPWRNGQSPTDEEQQAIMDAASHFTGAPMFFEDASDCTIQEIRAIARQHVTANKVKVVVIDSMSALHSNTRQARDNRVREVAECAEGCKEMAKELDVCVLLVAHVDKNLKRGDRPSMQDLRESGKIAMDSDSLWFLWEPDFNEHDPSLTPTIQVWMPKLRDSEPFVSADLRLYKQFTRFEEMKPDEQADQREFAI